MNSQSEIDLEGPYRLLYCSSKGDREGVMQELEKGVEPNLADYDKRTALHLASCEGCTEIVVLLLEKGADVNSVDRWGRTVSSVPSAWVLHKLLDILLFIKSNLKTHLSIYFLQKRIHFCSTFEKYVRGLLTL